MATASASQTEETDIVQRGAQPRWLNSWPGQEINLCFLHPLRAGACLLLQHKLSQNPQSVAPESKAAASPGNMLEMQTHGLQPRLPEPETLGGAQNPVF